MEFYSYIRERAEAVLQTSFLLMNSLNKTETHICFICSVFFDNKGNLLDFCFTISSAVRAVAMGTNIGLSHRVYV